MSENVPGVYKKMAQVMKQVGAVNKDSKHGQGFQYQSIEAVTSALRGIMADVGIIMLSECLTTDDTGSQWVCEYRFTFVDIEDGSNHSLSWQQATPHKDGKDDKAMGKNHTYAQKYFLLRTFMISSKDDVDADANDFKGEKAFTPKTKNSKKPIDLDAWNETTMRAFWTDWTGKGYEQDFILSALNVSKLSEWTSDFATANKRMNNAINKASGQ